MCIQQIYLKQLFWGLEGKTNWVHICTKMNSKHGNDLYIRNHKVGEERWKIPFINSEIGRFFYIWCKYSETMKKIDKYKDVDIKIYHVTKNTHTWTHTVKRQRPTGKIWLISHSSTQKFINKNLHGSKKTNKTA